MKRINLFYTQSSILATECTLNNMINKDKINHVNKEHEAIASDNYIKIRMRYNT